jgi:probable phosphoglycerate mutase
MDIFLVRHGEAAAAWGQDPDPGLSLLGEQQAKDAAELLLPRLPADVKLLSSPLQRAQETAHPFIDAMGIQISIDDAFREIPASVPLADRQNWLRAFMKQCWSEQPEELLQWRDHALGQLLKLKSTTVVFTHFLVLNAIVGSITGRAETLCFWPDNASVTQLNLGEDGTLELLELGAQMNTAVN